MISINSIEYIDTIEDELCIFENVNMQSIIAYLYTTYSHISEIDHRENNIHIMKIYNQTLPMSVQIKQLETRGTYATAGK